MNTETKICTKCGVEKPLADFYKNTKRPCGLCCECKVCHNIQKKKWATSHREEISASYKKYRLANLEKVRAKNRAWMKNHPENHHKAAALLRKTHPKKVSELRKKLYHKNYATPKGNLEFRMANSIRRSIRYNKAGRTWESLVGYSVWDLQVHLQSKFILGMTWERFLKGEIHIDHIIPKSRFHYETPDDPEFKVCWGLSNLQPLWAKDNILKGAKVA